MADVTEASQVARGQLAVVPRPIRSAEMEGLSGGFVMTAERGQAHRQGNERDASSAPAHRQGGARAGHEPAHRGLVP